MAYNHGCIHGEKDDEDLLVSGIHQFNPPKDKLHTVSFSPHRNSANGDANLHYIADLKALGFGSINSKTISAS